MIAFANPPRFDSVAFARRLAPAVQAAGGVRAAAAVSGVDAATISRACNVWPTLSHENWLRLTAWLDSLQELAA